MQKNADQLYEYARREGNYGMKLLLAGAYFEERIGH